MDKYHKITRIIFTILILLLVCVCTGCDSSGSSKLKHNGKGSVELIISSELGEEDFRTAVDKYIEYYNQGENYLKLQSIEKLEDNYAVNVKFRRIDKFSVNGTFYYGRFNEFADGYKKDGFSALDTLEEYENGVLEYSGSESAYDYEKGAMIVNIVTGDYSNPEIKPKDANGNIVTVADMLEGSQKTSNRTDIVMMKILNVEHLVKVRIQLPGNVKYYSSECFTIIDGNILEIVPTEVNVDITYASGEILRNEKTKAIFGYIVYEKTISPLAIWLIIVGSVLVVSLATIFVLRMKTRGAKILNGDSRLATELQGQNPILVGIKSLFKSKTWTKIVRYKWLYVFLIPAIVFLIIFNYAPMGGLIIAFQDFKLEEGIFRSEFIGLDRFQQILFDPRNAAYTYYRNTIYISLIRIGTNFPAILIFTLLLHSMRNRKAKGLTQIISYIPYFISWIAVGGMAFNLFREDGGLLNKLIVAFGGEKIKWYAEPDYWWIILAISSLWKSMGWSTLIYMASLGSINEELYDACAIDGGGKFRQAISVTIPGIMPVVMLQLLLDVGSILSDNYDQILAMTNGSELLNATTAVVGLIEFNAISDGINVGFSRATALALIRGVIGTILVLGTNKIVKLTDNEGII